MIEGLLRHCTDAEIESNDVDIHGASVVGFALRRGCPLEPLSGAVRTSTSFKVSTRVLGRHTRAKSPTVVICLRPRNGAHVAVLTLVVSLVGVNALVG
jgi:hypothetical protein